MNGTGGSVDFTKLEETQEIDKKETPPRKFQDGDPVMYRDRGGNIEKGTVAYRSRCWPDMYFVVYPPASWSKLTYERDLELEYDPNLMLDW